MNSHSVVRGSQDAGWIKQPSLHKLAECCTLYVLLLQHITSSEAVNSPISRFSVFQMPGDFGEGTEDRARALAEKRGW